MKTKANKREVAYIQLSDEAPEAGDYEGSYLYFDGSSEVTVSRIHQIMRKNTKDESVREELRQVCAESLREPMNRRNLRFRKLSRSLYRALKPKLLTAA